MKRTKYTVANWKMNGTNKSINLHKKIIQFIKVSDCNIKSKGANGVVNFAYKLINCLVEFFF